MTTKTRKWKFKHCFYFYQRTVTAADLEQLTKPYKWVGSDKRLTPKRADVLITDVEIRRDDIPDEPPGESSWCITGVIETRADVPEKVADSFSWDAIYDHAYKFTVDDFWGAEWYGGAIEPLGSGHPPAATPVVSPADLQVINRYRASMGRAPIDARKGWSPRELAEMAQRIRTTGRESNPRTGKLKRKLLKR